MAELAAEAGVERTPQDTRRVATMLIHAINRVQGAIPLARSPYLDLFEAIVELKPLSGGVILHESFDDRPYRITMQDFCAVEQALNRMGTIDGSPATATAKMHRTYSPVTQWRYGCECDRNFLLDGDGP